jgi:oligoendopeptidase F
MFPIIMFVAMGNVFAQQRAPSAEEIVANMKKDLNLTDEQAIKITPVVRNQIQQMQAIIEQAQQKIGSQMQTLQQSTEAKLSQYLTPEQMAQFRERIQQPQQQRQPQQSQQKTNSGANPIDAARSGNGR